MAMLNMFRSMGDFTADQVEIHGATLLSWARGWLRYSRNAVLRSTLENKSKEPVKLLAEALQHDLHSETDFTSVPNLRRCTLLRLIYFQWQAINKLGTKSQSMYRDYESKLREIDALPTFEDQEREWESIIKEEQQRRLEIIRDSRQRSDSVIQPRNRVRPEQMYQSRIQMNVTAAPPLPPPPSVPPQMSTSAPVSATAGQSELAHGTSAMQQLSLSRRQSADWLQAYQPPAQSPTPGPSHYHYSMQQQQQQQPQHYQGAPLPSPSHLHYRQNYYQPAHQPTPQPPPPPLAPYPRNLSYINLPQHQQRQLHYRPREPDGDMQVESMDNDSEMSVNMSPEPQ
ncbi:hypothetical protein GGI03_003522 [Coemansia sp. RSA 2337]|nr:hypothetical protein GGI03_003522 [Coemansia sp. RSA 2337]